MRQRVSVVITWPLAVVAERCATMSIPESSTLRGYVTRRNKSKFSMPGMVGRERALAIVSGRTWGSFVGTRFLLGEGTRNTSIGRFEKSRAAEGNRLARVDGGELGALTSTYTRLACAGPAIVTKHAARPLASFRTIGVAAAAPCMGTDATSTASIANSWPERNSLFVPGGDHHDVRDLRAVSLASS